MYVYEKKKVNCLKIMWQITWQKADIFVSESIKTSLVKLQQDYEPVHVIKHITARLSSPSINVFLSVSEASHSSPVL